MRPYLASLSKHELQQGRGTLSFESSSVEYALEYARDVLGVGLEEAHGKALLQRVYVMDEAGRIRRVRL